MTDNQIYRSIILDGCSVETNDRQVSLCLIDDYYKHRHGKKKGYQVHSIHRKFRFTEIYDDLDAAVDKFLLIKNKVCK